MVDFSDGTWRSLVDGTEYSAISDAVASLYEYEDDSDTTTAIDSKGSNDATITGASYTTTAKVGSLALSHDGSDDKTESNSTVDLSAAGDTAGLGVAAWIYVPSGYDSGSTTYWAGWGADNDNLLMLINRNGNIGSFLQVNGSNDILTGTTISTGTWYHVYSECQSDGTHVLKVDNTQEGSSSSGFDPSNIGSATYQTGARVGDDTGNAQVIVEDFAPANDPLSDSEIQTLIDRSN